MPPQLPMDFRPFIRVVRDHDFPSYKFKTFTNLFLVHGYAGNLENIHYLCWICMEYLPTFLDPPRGAKWMVRDATKQLLRVQTPPLGGCWFGEKMYGKSIGKYASPMGGVSSSRCFLSSHGSLIPTHANSWHQPAPARENLGRLT